MPSRRSRRLSALSFPISVALSIPFSVPITLFSIPLVTASVAQGILETKEPMDTGIIHPISGSTCGGVRATKEVTAHTGPNGHIDWLNCGFATGHSGWQPPHIRMEDIITQPLSTAFTKPDSPFKACSQYIWIFEKYGAQYNIPPIILASFAMQESSCRADAVGGGGEQGLMQISTEKCAGAPPSDCRDPDFNIHTATKYFASTLKKNGGDVLISVGTYNGWYRGLTMRNAFAAANSDCCRCQNNGDYLHQFFNGWCQNIDAYDSDPRLGKYFNLDKCQ